MFDLQDFALDEDDDFEIVLEHVGEAVDDLHGPVESVLGPHLLDGLSHLRAGRQVQAADHTHHCFLRVAAGQGANCFGPSGAERIE